MKWTVDMPNHTVGRRQSASESDAAVAALLAGRPGLARSKGCGGQLSLQALVSAEVDDREQGEEQREQDAQRGRLAVVEADAVLERVAEDQLQDRQGRVGRAAERQQERLEEDLRCSDDLQDEGDQQHRAQLRKRDVPDLLPDARAIHLGRVVQLGRHAGQRGEVDDHRAARRGPGRLEHDRGHRGRGALDPRLGRDADPAQDGVEHAVRAGVEEDLPEQHRRRRAARRPAGRRAR